MRRRRARNLFWTLALVGGVMSLIGPELHGVQASVAALFAPVSRPAYLAGRWVTRVSGGEGPLDAASPGRPRGRDKVYRDNERLRTRTLWLEAELAKLQEIHRDRLRLGKSLLPRLAAAKVVGGDGEVLNVLNSDFAAFRAKMPVLQYGADSVGVAGIVSAVGVASAQVRLVSDPRFAAEGRFARFPAELADGQGPTILAGDRPLVEGAGENRCVIKRYREASLDEAGVKVGDWITLEDRNWPDELNGLKLGRVGAITPLADKPGFARIDVEPGVDFAALDEVMVMVK